MKTISEIKPQKRRKDRVSVYLDGDFWMGMPLVVITDQVLYEGLELDDERIEMILRTVAEETVVASAVRLISHRPRSEKELRGRLADKEYGPDQIDFAVQRMVEWGMLDDDTFAELVIASQRAKGKGRRTVFYELTKTGIPRDRAQELLDEQYPSEAETEVAADFLQAKGTTDPGKAQRQLASRGFGWDIIKAAVREVIDGEDFAV